MNEKRYGSDNYYRLGSRRKEKEKVKVMTFSLRESDEIIFNKLKDSNIYASKSKAIRNWLDIIKSILVDIELKEIENSKISIYLDKKFKEKVLKIITRTELMFRVYSEYSNEV